MTLSEWKQDFGQDGSINFEKITSEKFEPFLKEAIAMAKEQIEKITTNDETPTFKNTIEAIETLCPELDLVINTFYMFHSSLYSPELEKVADEFEKLLTEFQNWYIFNRPLFERVKVVYESPPIDLTNEQNILLRETYKHFEREGCDLSLEDRKTVEKINQEISQNQLQFSNNSLKARNSYRLFIEKKEDLAGIPERFLIEAKKTAEKEGRENAWALTLDGSVSQAVMKNAENENLRKEIYTARATLATQGETNNLPIAFRIAQLREKKAKLLKKKNYAEWTLAQRMAKTPDTVISFLNKLLEKSLPAANKEIEQLRDLKKKSGKKEPLAVWDTLFYGEKLKKKELSFTEEEMAPYLPLPRVRSTLFSTLQKLYNLSFKKTEKVSISHPNVTAYEVYKDNDYQGLLYMDLFQRESKRSGAWCSVLRSQNGLTGDRPHVYVACNFSLPSEEMPSLLTISDVETLFHEMGHAIHGLLSKVSYRSLSGTSVKWDFVELPSQILENWVREKSVLQDMSFHWKDETPLPEHVIEGYLASKSFLAGLANLGQLRLSFLDMAWHIDPPKKLETKEEAHNDNSNLVREFENKVIDRTEILARPEKASITATFGHVFEGGYESGYYSYKWAELLEADAFGAFQEKGIFNNDVAQSFYENILSKGGSEEPDILYRNFRGRDPQIDAMLRRDGLVT